VATSRPFAYNTGSAIPGTEQVGNLAVGIPTSGFSSTGIAEWWNGPDEELGYVIACQVPSDTQPTPVPPTTASVGFFRSDALTEPSFVEMTNNIFGQIFLTGDECKTYLNTNGYWTSWGTLPGGMVLYLDSGVSASYSGSGSTWYDLSGYGNNGTINGATYVGGTAAAFSFNGSNNYVDFASVTDIPIGNEPYTISVWFNSDEMPADRGFVGWGNYGSVNEVNAWRLRDSGVSGFRHYWWGNDLDYTTPMSAGNWYNAVAAYQNGSRKLYLNNVKVAEDNPTGHNVPSASNLTIGVTNYTEWFKGKIAQVVIYKRQATESEITAIWNSGKNRFGA